MLQNAVDVARSMGPTIIAHRLETEANRRLAQPIVDRLADNGLCRMFLEEEFGGLSACPTDALRAYEALAGFEASVPWIAWNNALVCCFSRFLEKEVRKELFLDPTWIVAQSTRPSGIAVPTPGGFRISGRWTLVSGCELAEWLLLNCTVDGEMTRFVVAYRNDFAIEDTWRSGGLRGTGSHDVTIEDAFVAEERTLAISNESPPSNEPIARVPIIVHMTAAFAAQALGVATACIDAILETARTSEAIGPIAAFRERIEVQQLVTEHSTSLDAAREHLYTRVSEIWDKTTAGDSPGVDDLGRVYAAAIHTNSVARKAADAMYALGGSRALYIDSPLERAHRDIHAMLRHIVAQPAVLTDAGRARLGLEPSNPLYAV